MTALGSILRQGRRPYMGTLLPRPSSGSSHQSDTDVLRTPKWDKVDKTTSSAKFLKNTSKGDRDFFFLVMVVLPFQVRMAGILFFFRAVSLPAAHLFQTSSRAMRMPKRHTKKRSTFNR